MLYPGNASALFADNTEETVFFVPDYESYGSQTESGGSETAENRWLAAGRCRSDGGPHCSNTRRAVGGCSRGHARTVLCCT